MSSNHTIVTEPDPIFGRLTLDSIPFEDPIIMTTFTVVTIGALGLVGSILYFGKLKYLWDEWFTSVDHKKIGIMYIIVALIMLFRGFSDALLMRSQQAVAVASESGAGYLPPEHYDQIFTAHGVIMIFFVAMPLIVGLMNIIVPLQIGARDVAFPFLNSLSFWLFVSGALLMNISLFVGEFAATGWLAYPPLSGIEYSPWVGVDYWLWALQISGIGTLLTGVNFVVTILRMRAPGMTLMKMPVFTWTSFCANVLIVVAFPILTVSITLLTLDRYLGTHFFTGDMGGNQMMYVNLIWAWGHPEVYILILPAFGIFSEVTATFSRKRLFGYDSLVWATVCIMLMSFVVWLHHFFTMGAGANVNAFFGIATMIISIPTGVKIFNWLFTMYKGRVEYSASMWWTVSFFLTFTIGGMTGVMLAIPAADFVLHNSLFLVAHFHNVIIGGSLFGYFAGLTYWWPKATGFTLDERLGKWACGLWTVGFFMAFMPLYVLGFMGMTRRLNYYDNPVWNNWLLVAGAGAIIVLCAIGVQFYQMFASIRDQKNNRDWSGDPWDGRTLEWATSSPPPFYNFALLPNVRDRDHWADMKEQSLAYKIPEQYQRIHMPKNTWAGVVIGGASLAFGFAMVWWIWWMAILSSGAMLAAWIAYAFSDDKDYYVEVDEILAIEQKRYANLRRTNEKPLKDGEVDAVTISV
ncbi:cytochrome o ubiquinol oxidase subunit I [Porticoccaceae bacterium]|nr:cytochrome o ubiquinol oxidase subunit I [Porticoccaceae bacterium]MDA8682530.1 cytochrome o ubiquinol oxidase subunit I [Porticoccaceae bacterium]MDA8788606.1 cytochrome o ubiquinol oxidase subunit I [Porticoccaceae bacterium]MDB2343845.1 cytochrome o ubiquinol oxidase subunit I [Porticoccaceae bacterium]MDB2633919.1 cytochrome o ubiquinol oxidase subunit I [Porticoccaceae bacterium]